jgi:hypothetical protein
MRSSIAGLAFAVLTATPAAAAILHVDAAAGTNAGTCTSPASPCKTLTYAMGQATSGSPGDEILVAPGTYDSALGEAFPVVVKSGVRLRTTSGAPRTIVDASQTGNGRRVLELVNTNADTLVEGFTITGGMPNRDVLPPYGTSSGGGMRIDGGSPTIRANIFLNNLAQGGFVGDDIEARGGGIHALNATPIIVNNVFRGNQARGGLPCCLGVHTLYDGGPGKGGAIYLEGIGGTISNNTFYQNAAIGHDGSSNPAGQLAPGGTASHGAVYANGASVSNNIFASNYAQGGRAGGGAGDQASATFAALQAVNAPGPISNNLFVHNTVNGVVGTDDTFGTASVCSSGPPCPGAYFHGEPSDLRITSQSPAAGAGTATGAPAYDLAGVARPNPPAIGAFEPSAAVDPVRPVNISARAHIGTGDNVMIGGFVIYGSTPKTVVVRARGPSLAQFGVPGTLANPQLTLYSGQAPIDSNDDWQQGADAAQVQASGFAPLDAAESAIIATLQPGGYTAIVSGVGSTTGVAIVEVFEVDAATTPLVNVSARALVQTGDNVMIAGFIIQGDTPLTVVIRARGPSLAQFGVPGPLANPQLTLYSGQTPIASNDDWQQAANAPQITTSGFAPSHSAESAILVTLQPGAYTAIVNGANATTGVAIVEVFKH